MHACANLFQNKLVKNQCKCICLNFPTKISVGSMAIIIVDDYRYFLNVWAAFYVGSCVQLVHRSHTDSTCACIHIVHVQSLLFCLYSVVETRVGRQVQLHRQEVYESLKEYLKGGYFVIPYSQKYWRE